MRYVIVIKISVDCTMTTVRWGPSNGSGIYGTVTKTSRMMPVLYAISLSLSLICRSKEKIFFLFSQTLCQAWKLEWSDFVHKRAIS